MTPDRRVRVFVSSTLGELAAEREAARTAVRTLRLSPVMFELGARPHPSRDLYRAYIAQSDVFVGIYWQSYGWVAPDTAVSGIEDEYALSGDRPRLIYVKEPAPDRHPRLEALLDHIRADDRASYKRFESPGELAELLLDDLAVVLSERFAVGGATAKQDLPSGTLTFVFVDIEGSTKLLERLGDGYTDVLHRYHGFVDTAVAAHGGVVVDTEGDGVFCVFTETASAAEAAVDIQRALATDHGGPGVEVKARIGVHTGQATVTAEGYVGLDVHRAARIGAAGHGGQILVSSTARVLLADVVASHDWYLRDLGSFVLRGVSRAERLYQLHALGPSQEFPPPRARRATQGRLPAQLTSLVGRSRQTAEIASLFANGEARLVTLTGAGGIGKTRLALAVAERLGDRFGPGIVFVPLAAVARPEMVVTNIARAVGADMAGTGSPLEALVESFGDGPWLLVLDNLEQVVDAAGDLDALLARCPGIVILATSRTALRLRAEREYPVPGLPLPADPTAVTVDGLASSPAAALFVDRARAVRPDFALTEDNAPAVVAICRRLEGVPLAIELAAARIRLLDPEALLGRLTRSLDALGTGPVDLPERQRSLRATVEWSVGLLDDAERSLLETAGVFVDGWTIEAAAHVANMDEDRTLDLTEALVRHSLVQLDLTDQGPRFRMLETVREFVAERLAVRLDVAEIERSHADHYRVLAERAYRPLRVGQHDWAEGLQAEEGNLRVAIRWYLAHDIAPLPHMFCILWLFWRLRDHMAEGRAWVDELMPRAAELDDHGRAELLVASAITAIETGDDAGALAAAEGLERRGDVDDPYLDSLAQMMISWTLPIVDDLDGARRAAAASLDGFRQQDEPYMASSAIMTLGALEMVTGQHDAARDHLTEVAALGDQTGNELFASGARVQLAMLAVEAGRLDAARALLDEAFHVIEGGEVRTHTASFYLVAQASLMLAEHQPRPAALAMGAADGLRRRAGVRVWPARRRAEAELLAQIERSLDPDVFKEAFTTGAELNRREAIAVVRREGSSESLPD
jgi:predicted ATPase/class 3 adenylate cyclase